MLHLALGRLGVESLHATMPGKFRFGRDETPEAIVSDEALRSALLGLRQRIDTDPHPLNSPGTARGRLTGGNLAIVCSSLGTPEEPDFDAPTVLFIEEVGEHMYRLDRMMQQLARSGKLAKCKAILVGHFPTWPDKNISASPTPTTSLRNTCGRWESRSSSACPRGTKTPMWRSTWGAKLPSRWAKRVPPSNSDEGSGVQRNGPAPPGQQGGGATAPGKAAGLRRSGESLPLRAIALRKK